MSRIPKLPTCALPDVLRINRTHYRLALTSLREAWGHCFKSGVILIDTQLTAEKRASTLLHEVVHAILFEYGYDGGKEKMVEALEHELITLLRDCPEFLACLIDGAVQYELADRDKKPRRRKQEKKMAKYGKGGGRGKGGKSGVCFKQPMKSFHSETKRSNAGSVPNKTKPNDLSRA